MDSFFTVEGVRKTVFGTGAINTIAQECSSLGAGRVLVVMDRELSKTVICERALDLLRRGRVKAVPYPEITPEPSPSLADKGAELARQEKVAAVIGIGGGSTLDVAKAIAMLAKNEGAATDFIGLGLVKKPGLPSMMIPTTAGTGSEVTFTAVFTMRETKTKGGINSPFLYPHVAIVDPELTLNLGPGVTASTGMDAFTHAVESFTSLQAHFISEPISLNAAEIISANLRGAVFNGKHYPYRENMMRGSYLAGQGLAMAGVGAVHALAYPLGAMFDIPHGLANAVMLPYVLEYNFPGNLDKFCQLALVLGEEDAGLPPRDLAANAVSAVFDLSEDIGIPASLEDLKIPRDAIPQMAQAAIKVARPIMNNPRPVSAAVIEQIYNRAFEGRNEY